MRKTASLTLGFIVLVLSGHARLAPRRQADEDSVTFVGAGDIANCDQLGGARATANLLDGIPGTIFTLGDHAYPKGSAKDFADCYDQTWGRHKARTRPAIGNHDLLTGRGQPYFDYFGESAGPRFRGYYSYDLGAWHIISLNGTEAVKSTSPQVTWLREDLTAHPSDCVLAYWHMPMFSSGPHGGGPEMKEVWKILYDAGADVVISSHDHVYERFKPMDADGKVDEKRGIREFLVGTGGASVYKFQKPAPNSEIRDNSTYGVLKFTLSKGHYAWQFVPMAGQKFTDSGQAACSP